jgi:hypothetical protein
VLHRSVVQQEIEPLVPPILPSPATQLIIAPRLIIETPDTVAVIFCREKQKKFKTCFNQWNKIYNEATYITWSAITVGNIYSWSITINTITRSAIITYKSSSQLL